MTSTLIFWLSAAWVVYVYAGYPLLVLLLRKVIPRPVRKQPYEPRVTIVTAAFNEERHIAATIANKLALDYPAGKLEIIVVSDGSTDRTDELVRSFEARGVTLMRQGPRAGKTAALNLALQSATGDIVVFSDANSIYAPDALRHLLANFSDPAVGYVTGKMVYVNPDGSNVGDGCTAYMRYENLLRASETAIGSIVGVDGGVDAVRRSLYIPMRADQIPDFVLPLQVVRQGYRVVYEPEALLQENSLSRVEDEFRMRVRVTLRALWALWDMRKLLAPWNNFLFAWQLWSHKVLRYLVFIPMLALVVTNLVLLDGARVYQAAAVAQIALYVLAAIGILFNGARSLPGAVALASYLVLVNAASLLAFTRFMAGKKQVLWKPRTG
jgi:cellulose synthase/poly-beta-1,6-N-acetylglucosamine synthase-like glycosyltransferase